MVNTQHDCSFCRNCQAKAIFTTARKAPEAVNAPPPSRIIVERECQRSVYYLAIFDINYEVNPPSLYKLQRYLSRDADCQSVRDVDGLASEAADYSPPTLSQKLSNF